MEQGVSTGFAVGASGQPVQLPTGPYLHVPPAVRVSPAEPVTGASILAFMDDVYRQSGMPFLAESLLPRDRWVMDLESKLGLRLPGFVTPLPLPSRLGRD